MPTAQKSWKFLCTDDKGRILSQHGRGYRETEWKIGEWMHVDAPIQPCYRGFHHSPTPFEALTYVTGTVLARVEVKGTRVREDEWPSKEAVSDMRIVRAGQWGTVDGVSLSLYVAELAAEGLTGTTRRQLAAEGITAVRAYLRNSAPIPKPLIIKMRDEVNATSSLRQQAGLNAVNYALYEARDASDWMPVYAVNYASGCVDGYDRWGCNKPGGSVYVKVNAWLENRFKTLPRF